MLHYDSIPAGKKPQLNKESGEYELVDLKTDNVDDLRIMLDESNAKVKELEAMNKNLEIQLQKHQDSKKK